MDHTTANFLHGLRVFDAYKLANLDRQSQLY
jgi:hypothetical protein